MYNYIILYICIYIYICFMAGQDFVAEVEDFKNLTKPEQLAKIECVAKSKSFVYCGIGFRQQVVVAFRLVPFPIGYM